MSINVTAHQAHTYTVSTPVYEGPLDLLLQLIERAELDISSLSLSLVTEQYLEHMRTLDTSVAEEVSAFLVIAAKLIQIKSESLLPRPAQREEGEEDPGEALAQQLIAYKRFKELSFFLERRESENLRTYLRLAAYLQQDSKADLSGLDLTDLIQAAQAIFSQEIDKPALASVVAAPRITIREKIVLITRFLRLNKSGSFRQLLGDKPVKLDVVVTFLALLELVKRHLVATCQENTFGEISLDVQENWEDNVDFELEFGE